MNENEMKCNIKYDAKTKLDFSFAKQYAKFENWRIASSNGSKWCRKKKQKVQQVVLDQNILLKNLK